MFAVAVLSVLLTAPAGAVGIAQLGPVLLDKDATHHRHHHQFHRDAEDGGESDDEKQRTQEELIARDSSSHAK